MTTSEGNVDAVVLLTQDHRNVEQLFERCLAGGHEQRMELVKQVCRDLIVHTQIEEEIFYPSCRANGVDEEILNVGQVENDVAKILIAEVLSGAQDPFQEAKIKVLSEYFNHHVNEEEKAGKGVFARAQEAGIDMAQLGKRLESRKAELTKSLREGIGLTAPRPLSLHIIRDTFDDEIGHPGERERDSRGRLVPEEDERQSPRRHVTDVGCETRRRPGGWQGDPQGHPRASPRGLEERRDRGG
jgi:hypothetical protein